MRYILIMILLVATTQLRGQDTTAKQPAFPELLVEIRSQATMEKKKEIFYSADAQNLIKQNSMVESGLAMYIALQYIEEGDKENSIKWMQKTKLVPIVFDQVQGEFFRHFQEREEHRFIVDHVASEMDSISQVLSRAEDADGKLYNYYLPRIGFYVKSLLALEAYQEVYDHFSLLYKYGGNKFHRTNHYYQYGDALQALGKHEEAIQVFAKYNTEKLDFSADIQEKSDELMARIPGGIEKFEAAVEAAEENHRQLFRKVISGLQEINGVDLKARVADSKYILLDFWGTWCLPCAQSHPKLIETYNQYKDLGFEVIGIATENGSDLGKVEDVLQKEIEKQGLPWLQTLMLSSDRMHPTRGYVVIGYPTKILVDNTGKVIARLEGASYQNSTRLNLLLAELLGDEESRYRAEKIRLTEIPYNAFQERQDLEGKSAAYRDFKLAADLNVKDLSVMKDEMAKELALLFAEEKRSAEARSHHAEIHDLTVRGESLVQLLNLAEFDPFYVTEITGLLDKMTIPTMFGAQVPDVYTNVYAALCKTLINHAPEADKTSILKEYVGNISDKLFVADAQSRLETTTDELRSSLSYQFAKAYEADVEGKNTAKAVLKNYLNLSANYLPLRAAILTDFSDLPGLEEYIDKNKPVGTEIDEAYLNKLMLKKDINNEIHGIKALNGKYFLVDFWGSWCIPCRASHPHLNELYEKYKDKGFEIIGVASESPGPLHLKTINWKTAVQVDNIKWIQLLSHDREGSGFDPIKEFNVQAFPTKVLFDKDFNVIARYNGGDEEKLDAKLKELFGI